MFNNRLVNYFKEDILLSTKFNLISFVSTVVQLDKLYNILTRYSTDKKRKIVREIFDNIHGSIEEEFIKYAILMSINDELLKIKIICHMKDDNVKLNLDIFVKIK